MAQRVKLPQQSIDKLSNWYEVNLLTNTTVLQGSVIGWIFGTFQQAAVTINKTVHLTRHAPVDLTSSSFIALLGHELFHVVQQQEMGWYNFLLRYIWHWRPKHINKGREHPFEKPAYERQDEIEAALLN